MISWSQAVFLGILQGFTEFLPISSSGHLVLAQHLMGLDYPETMLAFDVALHFGTLLSVMVVFHQDLLRMIRGFFTPQQNSGRRLAWLIIIATIPAVIVGLGFKEQIEGLFVSPQVAAFGLLITGTLLWLTRKVKQHNKGEEEITRAAAFWVGCAQAIAITPGISRSGTTIAAGLFQKFDQAFAARFSFLMAIPAILGSVILEAPALRTTGNGNPAIFLLGMAVSAVTGFIAIKWLLRIISRGRLYLFAYYCWGIGLLALFLLH